jgi:hypothetical protein
MPNWLTDRFNNWLGSNITYITNAYSRSGYVWLLFHYERLTIDSVKLGPSNGPQNINISLTHGKDQTVTANNIIIIGTATNYNCEKMPIDSVKIERVRLPFKEDHRKRRYSASEFLTIFAENQNGTLTAICENFEISANRSFIITNQGAIKPSLYGGDIWTDENRYNHKPK